MSEFTSPHVNYARLSDYIGHTVRLAGLVLLRKPDINELLMKASDGEKVRIILSDAKQIPQSGYAEVVGQVWEEEDGLQIKARHVIEMGDKLDLELVDFIVQVQHDSRFASIL